MFLPLSFFSLGFISTALQVILLRQMAVAFGGNEMAWGVTLACWLLWVAAGSFTGGKLAPRITSPAGVLALTFFLLSALAPFIFLAPKAARWVLNLPPGQIVGLFPLTLAVFLISAFPCLLLGLLFSLNARWAQEQKGESLFGGVIAVYWWEALGAAAGGLYPSLLFYSGVKDVYTLYSLTLWGAVLAIQLAPSPRRTTVLLRALGAFLVLVVLALAVVWGNNALIRKQWGGHRLKASLASIFGQIDVLAYEEQVSFYQNGLLSFSQPDQLSAEEAVGYALLQHPHPQKVLLIGTGLGGAIQEALKYPELTLGYVELDPTILGAAREYLPPAVSGVLTSPRVKIITGDARPLLMRKDTAFDVIILNLPGPANAQLNRYYTREFFAAVKASLGAKGVFFFKVAAAEDYWSPNLLRYLATLRRTLETCFGEVLVIPGESALYFASPQPGALTADPRILSQRYQERKLVSQFVNPQLLPFRLRADRIKELKEKLENSPYEINGDLRPISYLYDSILWSAHFGGQEQKIMEALSRIKPAWLWAAFLLVPALIFLLMTPVRGRAPGSQYLCLFANGLTTISLEIVLLLIFQIFYGYVYFLLGLLIALFMVGLALGSWGGRKYAARIFTRKTLIFLQGVLLSIPFWLWLILEEAGTPAGPPGILAVFLYWLMGLVGVVGGLHFAAFSYCLLAEPKGGKENQSPASLGGPYAADLAGSSLGALMISALFIPLLGIPPTLMLLIAFNLMALVLLVWPLKKKEKIIHV